jgi:hypothetical protein
LKILHVGNHDADSILQRVLAVHRRISALLPTWWLTPSTTAPAAAVDAKPVCSWAIHVTRHGILLEPMIFYIIFW